MCTLPAMKSLPTKRDGFTLIELSIVLVIIGLVVGGIVFGQELIRAAEIRKQVSQIEKYSVAVNTFAGKYNCLPGDCPDAGSFFDNALGGNGDGLVDSGASGSEEKERWNFWNHLGQAQLIDGAYDSTETSLMRIGIDSPAPVLKGHGGSVMGAANFNSTGGIQVFGASNYTDISNFFGNKANVLYIGTVDDPALDTHGVYYAEEMYALDSKMDDGKPLSGMFRATNSMMSSGTAFYTTGAGTMSCIDDTTSATEALYNINQNRTVDPMSMALAGVCSPFVKLNR